MSPETWSWVAAGVSIAGLWLSGYSPRVGWMYGIASQGVWVTYGLATDQHGMIILSVAFVLGYLRNLRRWRDVRFGRPTKPDILERFADGYMAWAEERYMRRRLRYVVLVEQQPNANKAGA